MNRDWLKPLSSADVCPCSKGGVYRWYSKGIELQGMDICNSHGPLDSSGFHTCLHESMLQGIDPPRNETCLCMIQGRNLESALLPAQNFIRYRNCSGHN